MKVKRDFVTNSSSTSYVAFGYQVRTGKNFERDNYDDYELEKELSRKFDLPRGFSALDLHNGTALVGIVFSSGGGCITPVKFSEVEKLLEKLKELAKENNWKDEPMIFAGERYSE